MKSVIEIFLIIVGAVLVIVGLFMKRSDFLLVGILDIAVALVTRQR